MNFVNPEFVERYQMLYAKDPTSKVFAPLGEAYRKMGLLDAAFEVCSKGVGLHPHFPSGRVALAKVLMDRGELKDAIEQLSYAAELSPENLLAHTLLGEAWLKMRRPKDALRAFKMVLFLNPQDPKALEAVRKLESLTADEYDPELFAPTRITQVTANHKETEKSTTPPLDVFDPAPSAKAPQGAALVVRMRTLERYLSLADAFMVRNDLEKAMDTLKKAVSELGSHPEINSRLDLLLQREQDDLESEILEPLIPIEEERPMRTASQRKQQLLESLLQRINTRRIDG